MLTFLDHKGNEIGALTTFDYTNSVNGERSLSGTVHGNLEIEKGWGVRFEDEYYKVIYAKPKSLGKINIVQFDAVHQFFWDFDKSSVYSELDGSYPFQTFLDHIFNGSGYRYNLEVEVGSLRKQNFGLKKRLELFNDLIKHAGVEFQVRGKVVRILERTGTDLSTVVRKKLNLNDLSIEKRIGDFITYQKGLGAWHDENDHSKGRLEVEYVSPLAAIYGRLEGEPYVDERFTIAENFLGVLKKSVEDSYSISVQLAMEDLQKAGYRYTRPLAGDYITVIDEDINFKERVRIVSFETKYDIKGQVIDHTVTCNDIGSVKKQSAGYSSLKSSLTNVSKETESAIQTANRALVSADGKTTVYFGDEFPQDIPKGTLTKGDTLYLEVGDTTKMYYWNGAEWLEPPVVNDVEAFKESINTEIAQVNQSMQAQSEEHDRQVADILSKTQSVESLANQAKSDAANAIVRANQVKTEAIADARAQVATVSQALNTAKSELQAAIASADQKARDSQASATALRNDLNLQASKILAQAQAQTALTSRVSTVETLADGTKTTVAELSKTVSKATGDIASVSSRTKTVEDTLSQTRTQYEALTQTVNAQTGQIESINRRTGTIETGLAGVQERFENIKIGGTNYFRGYKHNEEIVVPTYNNAGSFIQFYNKLTYPLPEANGQTFTISFEAISPNGETPLEIYNRNDDPQYFYFPSRRIGTVGTIWQKFTRTVTVATQNVSNATNSNRIEIYAPNKTGVRVRNIKVELGNIATDWSPAEEDLRSEIAEYKRTVDQNYAGLQSTVSTLDGKVTQNKTEANQTATQLSNRLTSLETYKDAESTRAQAYFEASKTETAKQLTAERATIANNYVAKSIYDENVRGTTLKLNEIKTTADTAKQNLATYQETVDRKLTELTSSTQTLDGKINTASAKVDTVAGQIRTEISEVEGKIPTTVGGQNLIKNGGFPASTQYWSGKMIVAQHDFYYNRQKNLLLLETASEAEVTAETNRFDVKRNTDYTLSFYAFSSSRVKSSDVWFLGRKNGELERFSQANQFIGGKQFSSVGAEYITVTFNSGENDNGYIRFDNNGSTDGQMAVMYFGEVMLVEGTVARTYEPSPEEVMDEVKSVKTTITQTSQGVEQLSTSLSATNSKVTTAETKISQLISDVSSKVSQTDYNTLTGRVESAETAITQNASEINKRLTSTQVESVITSKGYQTKAQVDNNITGRGYITNSALQPYALSTTVQNLMQETAESFSRTISETKAMIPTEVGTRNLALETSSEWNTAYNKFNTDGTPINIHLAKVLTDGLNVGDTIQIYVEVSAGLEGSNIQMRLQGDGDVTGWGTGNFPISQWRSYTSPGGYVFKYSATVNENHIKNSFWTVRLRVDGATSGWVRHRKFKVERGNVRTDWSPAPEDLATVTALHSVRDTVDSHTRTIGAVGTAGSILDNVSKVTQTAAGLVQEVSGTNGLKTQVSTLAGSYAIKNLTSSGNVLNQLNLNKDGSVKIDGKLVQITGTTYIQDGVITSAKIAGLDAGKINTGELNAARIKANSIDGSKIAFDQAFFNGLMANEAYLKQLFAKNAFITSVQAVAISASNVTTGILRATNGAMDVNLDNASMVFRQDAKIEFQSENNTLFRTRNGTSAFIHFRDDGYNGVYTAMGVNADNTGTQNDYSSGRFAGVRVIRTNPNRYSGTTIDQVQLIGDEIRMRHGYGYENDYLIVNYDGGPKINLMAWLRQFNTNFMHLVNITGRGDVIKTF